MNSDILGLIDQQIIQLQQARALLAGNETLVHPRLSVTDVQRFRQLGAQSIRSGRGRVGQANDEF